MAQKSNYKKEKRSRKAIKDICVSEKEGTGMEIDSLFMPLSAEELRICELRRACFPKKGKYILIRMIDVGLTKRALDLIKERPDFIMERDNRGRTPLMAALSAGSKDIVAILLDRIETDVNVFDKDGVSAKDIAAKTCPEYLPIIERRLNEELNNIPIRTVRELLTLVQSGRVSVRKGLVWSILHHKKEAIKKIVSTYPTADLTMPAGFLSVTDLARMHFPAAVAILSGVDMPRGKRQGKGMNARRKKAGVPFRKQVTSD